MPSDRPIPQDLSHLVEAPFDEVRPLLEALAADPRPDDVERLTALLDERTVRLRGGTRSELEREFDAVQDFLLSEACESLRKSDPGLPADLRSMARQLKRAAAQAPAAEDAPEDLPSPDKDLRRETLEKSRRFEERIAELFRLAGYQTTIHYLIDEMELDLRLKKSDGPVPSYALVECKDWTDKVGLREVRELESKVRYARDKHKELYQAILVGRSGFSRNAHEVARQLMVKLLTPQGLLLSLVDLEPHLEDAVRAFQGTALEGLYVEQDVVLASDFRPGEKVVPRKLTEWVRGWLAKPTGTLLTLLGDFGSGKTSFCRRFACELALAARRDPEARRPVVVDLREGGSTTVTLENLLAHRCQRLSSQPVNPQALLHLNREGHLAFLFDGFDETIGYSEPARFVENLRQILRACEGRAKVVLTCRTHSSATAPRRCAAWARPRT